MTTLMPSISSSSPTFRNRKVFQANANAAYSSDFAQESLLAFRAEPPWKKAILEKIELLRSLKENWDSYGGAEANEVSIFLSKLFVSSISKIVGVSAPDVGLSPAGNVTISWEFANRTCNLDVEILPSGIIRFCFINEASEDSDCEGTTERFQNIAGMLTQWEANLDVSRGASK